MGISPGELSIHFLNAILTTWFVSLFVLWRYRISVLAGMNVGGNAVVPPTAVLSPRGKPERETETSLSWEHRARYRIGLAFLVAVLPPAAILTVVYQVLGGYPLTPTHLLMAGGSLAVATVPMAAIYLALPFMRALVIGVVVLVIMAITITVISMLQRLVMGREPTIDQLLNVSTFIELSLHQLWLPLLLVVATGARRIRGVAPIVLAGMLVFGLAPLLGSRMTVWLASTQAGSMFLVKTVGQLGIDGAFLAIAFPTGWLAWRHLTQIAAAYEKKSISDAELLTRTWWLMFCAGFSFEWVDATTRRLAVVATSCAVAYVSFSWLSRKTLAWSHWTDDRPPRRTLLLLRVFGYTQRTERVFDRIGARWRLFGPVTLISAPDLAARTIDPGDFLRFVSGRLATTFVTNDKDLATRMAQVDLATDPDGRYRVSDFCCRDNTWRATVVALMDKADIVLMDLRGLSPERAGCEFELQQLAERVSLEHIVLIVNNETDAAMIARAFDSHPPAMVAVNNDTEREAEAVFKVMATIPSRHADNREH